jgi:hypothetical protein
MSQEQDTLLLILINLLMRNLLLYTSKNERGDEAIHRYGKGSGCIDRNSDLNGVEEFVDNEGDKLKHNRILLLMMIYLCCAEEMEKIKQEMMMKQNTSASCRPPPAKKTRVHNPKFFVDPELGCPRPMIPTMSSWWMLYVQNPNPECKKWSKTFRSRFRLPYTSFVDLLNRLMLDHTDIILPKCRPTVNDDTTCPFQHVYGRSKISPVQLLLMGSLRYLGRGLTFDDLEECTFISRDVHRVFFHAFVEYGAKKLYPLYVRMPQSIEE